MRPDNPILPSQIQPTHSRWLHPPSYPRQPPPAPHCTWCHPHPAPSIPPIITCCVRGKSSIREQQGFGTADSCSVSSPTTSTKRQLSFTPKDFINWSKTQRNPWNRRAVGVDRFHPRCCLKMLRCWSTPTTPFKLPSHWEQHWGWWEWEPRFPSFAVASYFQVNPFILTKETLQYQWNLSSRVLWSHGPGGVSTPLQQASYHRLQNLPPNSYGNVAINLRANVLATHQVQHLKRQENLMSLLKTNRYC